MAKPKHSLNPKQLKAAVLAIQSMVCIKNLGLVSGVLCPPATQTAKYIFSFGDSYSTTGFNITGTKPSASNHLGNPAYPGIDTTGTGADGKGLPNWVGVLNNLAGGDTQSYNFAYSGATVNNSIATHGATTPDFITQSGVFLDNLHPQPDYAKWSSDNAIFASWFGINDVVLSYMKQQTTAPATNTDIMDTYFSLLEDIYDVGGRNFVIFTLPPLERTPVYSSLPFILTVNFVELDEADWNNKTRSGAAAFAKAHKDANVQVFDPEPIITDIVNNYKAYGYKNNVCTDPDGVTCLWADALHPGKTIQAAIGEGVYKTMQSMKFF